MGCRLRRGFFVALYCAEAFAVVVAVLLWGLPLFTCAMVVVVVLASNTALWGWRWLPTFLLACACGAGVGILGGGQWQVALNPLIDTLAAAGGLAFLLVICAVAHMQAEHLVQVGATLRSEKLALLRYLPKEAVTEVRPEQGAAFRRDWLTVAFVDLVDFSKATLELPGEALALLLNEFFAKANDHVEAWGGSVSKFLGDGLLCIFPTPSNEARVNTARQAVRCVEQFPTLMAQLNDSWRHKGYVRVLAVTSGVASGYCCTGHWGSVARSDYTAIGTPVNLASRLQGAAARCGGILIDEITAALVADAVALGKAQELALKGIGQRVAFPIGSPR